MLVEEATVAYSVDVERGMNRFCMVQLLMVRAVQRLKHRTVQELLLGGGLPRQAGRGEYCASLQHEAL